MVVHFYIHTTWRSTFATRENYFSTSTSLIGSLWFQTTAAAKYEALSVFRLFCCWLFCRGWYYGVSNTNALTWLGSLRGGGSMVGLLSLFCFLHLVSCVPVSMIHFSLWLWLTSHRKMIQTHTIYILQIIYVSTDRKRYSIDTIRNQIYQYYRLLYQSTTIPIIRVTLDDAFVASVYFDNKPTRCSGRLGVRRGLLYLG